MAWVGGSVAERVFWQVPLFVEGVFMCVSLGDVIVFGRVCRVFRVLSEKYLTKRGATSVLFEGRIRDGSGFRRMMRRTGAVLGGSLLTQYIMCPGSRPVGHILLFIDGRSEILWKKWLSRVEGATYFQKRVSFFLLRNVVEVRDVAGGLILIYVPLRRGELVFSLTSYFEYWNVMGSDYLCSANLRKRLGEPVAGCGRFLFMDGLYRRCVSVCDRGIVYM